MTIDITLTEIWIYPVKSLGGIRLERAAVLGKGLQFDRRWMLIDQSGTALTQRTNPTMALFKAQIHGGQVSIAFMKDQKQISSAQFAVANSPSDKWITARVWNDDVKVFEVDPTVSGWFSHHLGVTCKLVSFPEENSRAVDPRYSIHNDHVSLADAFPFLIIGESSLNDLNQRLTDPVPMNRFRPNFVFAGGTAHIEDSWRNVSIGRIPFVAVKKSERCALPTVDQETAEKGTEPLRTLSGYRKVDNKVFFGQNLIALEEGEVAVGDPVIPQ